MENNYFILKRVENNIYSIFDPAMVFCTLIIGKEKALLFDTGYGLGDLKTVIKTITDLPLIIVNSHGHVDHIGGNWQFDEVNIHEDDINLHESHSTKEIKIQTINLLKEQKIPPNFTEPYVFPANFSEDEYMKRSSKTLIPIREGHIFDLGEEKLEVIHIPGHTKGGIGLLYEKLGILFAGDAISPFLWMFGEESTSIETLIDSLYKLKRLNFNKIFLSHMENYLPKEFIDKLILCAKNIDVSKSTPFINPIANANSLRYTEGGEPFVDIDSISIIFNESKL